MKIFGLIGYPLSHSFSQDFFQKKFICDNIKDCCYKLLPISSIGELPGLINEEPGLCGLNVTIPYKKSVIGYLDQLSPEAKQIGAVNTIKVVRKPGKPYLFGCNTDIYGFEESLKPLLKPFDNRALILGTGGASLAVQFVLEKLKIPFSLVSRSSQPGLLAYNQISTEIIQDHSIIINTTPVGMYPHTGENPGIPYHLLNSNHLLFDLVYNPETTQFLEEGLKRGCRVSNGLKMLYLQAEKSWEFWNS
jgi:shikimate dehydrogenase